MRSLGIASILVLLCAGVSGARDASDDLIVEAMQDEMDRSMAGLRLPDQPAPYYIAYTIHDTTRTSLTAAVGALMADSTGRSRLLHVEVRVGDYDFDSSHFATAGRPPGVAVVTLDDDYLSLRRRIWMATDAAYKRAVDVYARKKATFQNRVNTDPIPDFSRETPREHLAPAPAPRPVGASWRDTVRHVSAIFGEMPEIHQAQVSLSVTQGTRYFLNSEGFKTVAPVELATLAVQAQTQAADGMALRNSFTTFGKTLDDLPSRAEATGRARELAANLVELRDAPVGDDYYGPVMLEGQAAGQLLARSLVPLFLSRRPPTRDGVGRGGGRGGGGGAGLGGGRSTPFLRRLGSRVLPESLTVTDTPSLTSYGNAPVPGAYVVDEEGVLAQDVTLVQDGRLMTLLTSRAPQLNLPTSNGHARGGDAQASVVSGHEHVWRAGYRLEGQVLGVVDRAEQTVRLHHPRRRRHSDGQGHARRPGIAGPRRRARARRAGRLQGHSGGVRGTSAVHLSASPVGSRKGDGRPPFQGRGHGDRAESSLRLPGS